jgi:Flp pilus assembly protein TadG
MMVRLGSLVRRGRAAAGAYRDDTAGAAGVEVAIWVSIMVLPILNVVDTGFYIYQRMQVENAAAAAAQAAWALCSTSSQWPATKSCSNLSTTLTAAAQGTSLGSAVTLQTAVASSYENYFCANNAGALVAVGTAAAITSTGTGPTLPNSFSSTSSPCSSAGTGYAGNTAAPSDYVVVSVTATYRSLFPGATVTSLFSSTMTGVARTRLQ